MFLPRLHNVNILLAICRRHASSTTTIIPKDDLPTKAYKPSVIEKVQNREHLSRATNNDNKPVFSMVLPPPNVTGKLHLGHALTCTVQDVIVRRNRSFGYNALWIPGTDHAGIATQGVVEKYLKTKYKINRQELGREKFNIEVWKWKEKYGDVICQQLKTLGLSLDWSKQKFTMDSKHVHSVNTAFITLFKKNLIYRKKALVNWCNTLKSTVSDIEVDNKLIDKPTELVIPNYEKPVLFGQMFYFAYKLHDSEEEIVVSTTMPETMFGDVAIAVHPDDERYKHLHNTRVIHPFRNETIPIIFDKFVDMKFGTGAVKITPAHSKTDYDVGRRHNLPLLQVINEDGCMNETTAEFVGMKKYVCREKLIKVLNELGLLRKVIPHSMTVPICNRTGDVIEYLPKEQWFLSCKRLNKLAFEAVESGKLKIIPEKFVKNWHQWTEGERDWCISRQLWWGQRIPAYKCVAGKDLVWIAAHDEAEAIDEASKLLFVLPADITATRDTDVLDTWFSSGIYPFASLGWPDDSEDFRKFYPLDIMVTGHDILGFWVHRMVILGLELTGRLPFNNIFLHGIICDSKGAKMSKSRGNVIDPVDVINGISFKGLNMKAEEMYKDGVVSSEELDKAKSYYKSNYSNTNGIPECGVDALRFTILSNDMKSHFVSFDIAMCHANKLFCNKIWQSVKFMQLSFAKLGKLDAEITQKDLNFFDRWILSKLGHTVKTVNESLDNYDFHLATKALRTLIYNRFCDVYLETTKPGFDNGDTKMAYAHAHTLSAVLNTSLRCLAPIMVYLTAEVIPKIPDFEKNIIHNFNDEPIIFNFPITEDFEMWVDESLDDRVEKILNAIYLIRQFKSLYGMTNKIKPSVLIKTQDDTFKKDIHENKSILKYISRCDDFNFGDNSDDKKCIRGTLSDDTEIAVELIADDITEVTNLARTKLKRKIENTEEYINKLELIITSSNYSNSVSHFTQNEDKKILNEKRKELMDLKRLITL